MFRQLPQLVLGWGAWIDVVLEVTQGVGYILLCVEFKLVFNLNSNQLLKYLNLQQYLF